MSADSLFPFSYPSIELHDSAPLANPSQSKAKVHTGPPQPAARPGQSPQATQVRKRKIWGDKDRRSKAQKIDSLLEALEQLARGQRW